ncbi:MAG TPA: J domain-containing protein [Actinomycetota bacterium]|nr:J domain-containing protein [Actinomycetota bacterium]
MATDFYEVLGVAPDAGEDEIKRAFRSLARRYHPDANGGDPEAAERYKQISEAYSILSDPRKRREYDAQRMGAGMFGTTIEDLFDSFFGGAGVGRRAGPQSRVQAGETIGITLEIDFADAVFGVERTLTLRRHEPCERCSNSGCEPGTQPDLCQACNGTGQLQQVRQSLLGQMVTAYPCAACGQTGWTIPDPCRDCRGAGRVPREVDVPLRIPAGLETNDQLRVRGEGHSGFAGGPRGDLIARVAVRPDERFERSGDDIVTWVEVPMTTAALGGSVRFESLDGPEEVEIPKGTQSGTTFRVRGRGMPRGRGRGDLLVRAHVATPTDLTGEQARLLEQLAELRGEAGHAPKGILASLRRALGMEE